MMQPESHYRRLPRENAHRELIRLLQDAHAGERAAANAYWGHGNSLFVRDKKEKAEIMEIYMQEIHHRLRLRAMLKELGAKPRLAREIMMFSIGFAIGFVCLFGGWFIPMYGAGKLESENVVEYEVAARLAFIAGHTQLVEELLFFAEIEWDHEQYFHDKAAQHHFYKIFPKWKRPDDRKLIQSTYISFSTRS